MSADKINLSGICNTPIDPEKIRRDYIDVNIKKVVVPNDATCVPTSSVYMSSNFFIVLREIADAIVKGTVWNKKARIVLEYDPLEPKMTLTTFMEPDEARSLERNVLPAEALFHPDKGTCLAKGNEFTFDPEYTVDPDAAPLESLGKFFLEVNEEERTMTIIPNAAPLQLTGKEAMALVAMIMEQTRSWSE